MPYVVYLEFMYSCSNLKNNCGNMPTHAQSSGNYGVTQGSNNKKWLSVFSLALPAIYTKANFQNIVTTI